MNGSHCSNISVKPIGAEYDGVDRSLTVHPALLRKIVYGVVLGVEEPVFCHATRSGWMADDGRCMTDKTAAGEFAKTPAHFMPLLAGGAEQADRIASLNAAVTVRYGAHRWFLRYE